MAEQEYEGSAGSGLVKVRSNGQGTIQKIDIDPSLLTPSEQCILEDLIVVALHDAQETVNQHRQKEMLKVTGGMNIPGLKGSPF